MGHEGVKEVININLGVVRGRGSNEANLLEVGNRWDLTSHELIEVDLVGDLALGEALLQLGNTVLLPVNNVGVGADTHGATGEDGGADVVIEARGADGVLVGLGGTSLLGEDETGTNPDTAGAHHERRGEELTVPDTTGGNNLDGLASQWGLVALDELSNGGDEDGGGGVTGVAATLATLSADDIDTEVEALLDVLGVADHVHVEDAVLVELLDDVLGGDTDGGNEELGAGLDDDVNQLVKLALGVIVAGKAQRVSKREEE